MASRFNRRDFVKSGTAGLLAAGAAPAFGQGPAVITSVKPVVISSANGHQYKNGGPRTCVEEAFLRITKGEDVLDALIAGVNIVELDPEENYVGYGGVPNADGVVQLDASCMHGPKKRAGAVAALEGVRTPSLVAKSVMDNTDHHLLVGKGAQDFARQMGFNIEADLNTPKSRAIWLEWKRRIDPHHFPTPAHARGVLAQDLASDDARGAPRSHAHLRDHQLRRRQRQGRDLRRDHHQRPRVQDPGPGGGLADPGRRPLGGRGRRRRRIDGTRRGEPLQPLVAPDRRGDAARPSIRRTRPWRR